MHAKIYVHRIVRLLHLGLGLVAFARTADAGTTLEPVVRDVGFDGATYQITVESDSTWTASTDASWLSVDPESHSGPGLVTVTVSPNHAISERSATIVIDHETHKLTQRANASLAFSADAPNPPVGPASTRLDMGTHALVTSASGESPSPVSPQIAVPSNTGNIFRADRNFRTRLETASGEIRAVAATPDGGFVVAGRFSTIAGQPHLDVARYKSDGTVDAAFNPNSGFDGEVTGMAVQLDGKIVVVGSFTTFNGFGRASIARLNADGTLDPDFNPGAGFDNAAQTIAIQADGKIVVGGSFTGFDSRPAKGLVRLNANGSLDQTFSVGTGFGNGAADNRPAIRAVALQADGKIIVGGAFDTFAGLPCQDIVRLNSTGSLDATFSAQASPRGSPSTDGVYALVVQQDRQIIVGGNFTTFNGLARGGLTRLNPDGTTDATFNTAVGADSSQVLSLALQADGRIVAGGNFAAFNGTSGACIIRLNTNGTVDASFNSGSGFRKSGGDATVSSLAILTDGRIAAGGDFTIFDNQTRLDVARLMPTGARDTLVTTPFWGPAGTEAATVVGGGKILVAGFLGFANGARRTGIARLNGDGSLDPTFALSGSGFDADIVTKFVVQPDGKIVVIGGFSNYNGISRAGIARLNTDGSLDPSFALAGSGFNANPLFDLALQADGKIVVSGFFTQYNGTTRSGVARLNADGSLDPGFNPGSGFDSPVLTLALQDDGKILAGGAFVHFNGALRRGIARLNGDGSLDPQFDPGAGFTVNNTPGATAIIESFAIQPDRKIVVGGSFTTYNGVARHGIARLNSNGALDGSFDPGTDFFGDASDLVIQPDGKIIAGDFFSTAAGVAHQLIVRLNSNGSFDHTFSVSEALGAGAHLTDDGRILVTGPGAIADGVVQVGFAVVSSSSSDSAGPVFTMQPASATVAAGGSATFTAAASGDPAPSYQWYKGTTTLAGQTGATLSLGNVQMADAGSYTVVATNSAGSTTSNAAVLTVTAGGNPGGYGGGGAVGPWFVLANLAVWACARRKRWAAVQLPPLGAPPVS